MSKVEKIKSIIDLLKSILITLIVALFGMSSYLFLNIENLSTFKTTIAVAAIVIDCIIIVFGVKVLINKINELERL